MALPANRVRVRRLAAGWSQAELASRAGISRAAVSAIEIERLDPSVSSALALAAALGCRAEDLFGTAEKTTSQQWAWNPNSESGRYWNAQVGARSWLYPVDASSMCAAPHDGVFGHDREAPDDAPAAFSTIVMATCDPMSHLLANQLGQSGDMRLLTFTRSSREALELLREGKVHVAGIHLASEEHAERNADAVRESLGEGYSLLRVAVWEEGILIARSLNVKTARSALRGNLRWIGRQSGSGARQCLDELLGGRQAPKRQALDHRGVVEAVRNGWADAGVALRILGEEAGLGFIGVRREAYDLCFANHLAQDRLIQALLKIVRSAEFRRSLGECPGYDTTTTGETVAV